MVSVDILSAKRIQFVVVHVETPHGMQQQQQKKEYFECKNFFWQTVYVSVVGMNFCFRFRV